MTSEAGDPTDFGGTVRTVGLAIVLASRRGDGTGMASLEERLHAVAVPMSPTAAQRGGSAVIEVVHASVVSTIGDGLLEATRQVLIAELIGVRNPDDLVNDPWGPLDEAVARSRNELARAELLHGQRSAVRACRHYGRTGQTAYLRDAVSCLEGARRLEARVRRSRITMSTGDAEFARLGAALARSVPPHALCFFADVLHSNASSACLEAGIRMGPQLKSRLAKWFTGGPWDIGLEDEPLPTGCLFEEPLHGQFAAMLDDERRSREAEANRRAEQQQRLDAWQARRDADRLAAAEAAASERTGVAMTGTEVDPDEERVAAVEKPKPRSWDEIPEAELPFPESTTPAHVLVRDARHDAAREEQRRLRKEYDLRTGHRRE